MTPEHSRQQYYDKLYDVEKTIEYDDKKNIHLFFSNSQDVKTELVSEVLQLLEIHVTSLSDTIPYTGFVEKTSFYFIDKQTMFLLLDLDEDNFGLFVGRGKNNLFALKRFLSNLSGKHSKKNNSRFAITMDIKSFLSSH